MTGLALNAPVLLKYEIANVARHKLRAGVPREAACSSVDALGDQRLVFHNVEPAELLDIGTRYGLTAQDAAYLALADQLRAPLLTFDQRLAEAAARHFRPPA
jgi:predicted nucleic acid-binding protein